MGFWHGVEYYEKERRIGEEFYQEWHNVCNLIPVMDVAPEKLCLLFPQFFYK